MADPISGAGGGAAKLALQEMMKQQQNQQLQNPTAQTGQSSFQQKLSTQQTQQTQQVSEIQKSHETTKTRSIRDMAGVNDSSKVNQTQKSQNADFNKTNGSQEHTFAKGVTRLMEAMKGRKKGIDDIIKKAMAGKKFSHKELLVLQYKVASYSMEMDLTSKVVEKATSGLKQAMNTQV